jgi:tripartite-type tricarboxylate transporter receptor subunit TctC
MKVDSHAAPSPLLARAAWRTIADPKKQEKAAMHRRVLMATLAAGALMLEVPAAFSQPSRTKPMRLIIGYAPGAQSDLIARLVAQKLGELLETSVVVENRPGANGAISAELVARAPADGHTLLLAGGAILAQAPALDSSVRYNALRDFVAIGRIARVPLVLAAHPSVPFSTGSQLIEYARRNPGKLTYGSGAALQQLAIELLKASAQVNIVTVPYKGTGPAIVEVLAGRVDLVLADVAAIAPHARSGSLRMIANAGAVRSRSFPDVPTMAEQGVPDFVWESWQGILVPTGTPVDAVTRLRRALRQALASATFREHLERLGIEPIDEAPEVFPAVLREEVERTRSLVKRVGLRVEP